jgi:hypothetical protein
MPATGGAGGSLGLIALGVSLVAVHRAAIGRQIEILVGRGLFTRWVGRPPGSFTSSVYEVWRNNWPAYGRSFR